MLQFSVGNYLNFKGIRNRIKFLQKHGFTYNSSRHIVSDKMGSIQLKTIEKLCLALQCTPNDILTYTPDADNPTPNQPLNALSAERFKNIITEGMQHLNSEELEVLKEQVQAMLAQKNKQ